MSQSAILAGGNPDLTTVNYKGKAGPLKIGPASLKARVTLKAN